MDIDIELRAAPPLFLLHREKIPCHLVGGLENNTITVLALAYTAGKFKLSYIIHLCKENQSLKKRAAADCYMAEKGVRSTEMMQSLQISKLEMVSVLSYKIDKIQLSQRGHVSVLP